MLYEFVVTYRDAIITKARQKLTARPSVSVNELEDGVPLFLTQLAETLRAEEGGSSYPSNAIGDAAARHGRDLLALGFTVSQVVHDYGDICQAVTELAMEQNAPITTAEFHTLNRCLDTAIAEAVTEHTRLTASSQSAEDAARVGDLAHDIGAMVESALLAFEILKRGAVAVNGNTGLLLGRNLIGLKALVESALTDIRLEADAQRRERVPVSSFLIDISVAARLQAEHVGMRFTLEPVDSELAIHVDPQVLRSAVTNLLDNAFKFTHAGGLVVLRAHRADDRLLIEVEDECGGIPSALGDPLNRTLDEQPGADPGLSMARKAVRAMSGHITLRNLSGRGCVFAIELALATEPKAGAAAPC